MKIYITRHGETESNIAGKMQGWKNSNLSSKGIENAKKLGNRLSEVNLDCIYSSPLGRAVETANLIKGDRAIEIMEMDSLKEMGFGCWEGMGHEAIQELYPKEHYHFWHKPHLYQPIDGESYEELLHRVNNALAEIINEGKGENILIVTHAVVLKAIYAIIKNYSLEELWNPPFMKDTSLTIIEVNNEERNLVLEACVAHLD